MNKPTMENIASQLQDDTAHQRAPVRTSVAPDVVQSQGPQFPEWDLVPPSSVLNRRRRAL